MKNGARKILGLSLVAQASRLCLTQEGKMPVCECGCERETKRGKFRPGHDQRLRAKLEKLVGDDGLLTLKALVVVVRDYVHDRISLESFGKLVKSIIPKNN
jgi:hypothetical protein